MSSHLKRFKKLKLQTFMHRRHHSKMKQMLEHVWEEEKRYWPLVLALIILMGGIWMWSHKNENQPSKLHSAAPALYTNGFKQGAEVSQNLAKTGGVFNPEGKNTALSFAGLGDSLVGSNQLSKTGGAAEVSTKLLQKSLLSTFYFGQGAFLGQSPLENDTKLLSEMENVLSVDLFQYLNQSIDRSDSLQNYLHLMSALQKRAQDRQNELISAMNFLEANIEAQEQLLSAHEENFFGQLKNFQGQVAEEQLNEFVAAQKQQAENKAKLGVYESLENYYNYYNPLLQARIEVVQANAEALIAGVKVVNLPGIDGLGLIVEED